MPILPGDVCQRCADRGDESVPAAHELDAHGEGSGGGAKVCENCLSDLGDAEDARKLEA